jgi:heterodisulfide reductase subunit A
MMDAGRHPRIELHTLSEVIGLDGRAGAFRARVRQEPRYVDPDLCVGCGLCSEECPSIRPNPFDVGLKAIKAIDRPFPQAVPATYHIDREACLNGDFIVCERCARVCEPQAINYDDRPREFTLDVGAVVVATGFDELDPRELLPFGYGRAPNVLTGLEFERLLCATGPTSGHVLRPTDHKVPERIVFVQCVGSRGEGGRSYCSRYCCMNSVKSALLAHDHEPTVKECVLLYTDMRAAGRGYDGFVARSEGRDDIRKVRGRPSKIQENPQTGDLTVWVEDFESGRPQQIKAQMVVLSTAALPTHGTQQLAAALGIELDHMGFLRRRDPETAPAETTRPGIYVAGSAGAPAIIPECVAQGTAASAEAAVHVLDSRETVEKEDYPDPIDISGPPRIGVFVCHCGANIGGVIDVETLAEKAGKLPHVVYSTDESFACADISQRAIEEAIKEQNLTRVVVAACTPRTHEPVFREALARAGLNPFLFEMVNIRDQCTWVHAHVPVEAQARAWDQIRMGVARAAKLEPLTPIKVDITRRTLVIGGGVAGIRAALDLDAQGYEVHLIEKSDRLGGLLAPGGLTRLYTSGEPAAKKLASLTDALKRSGVKVHLQTDVGRISGFVGNFEVETVAMGGNGSTAGSGKGEKLAVGTIILAIGAKQFDPQGLYGYGEKGNVVTNLELEHQFGDPQDSMFGEKGTLPRSAVFIQCVGSRSEAAGCNPGCSRYCCPASVKQATELAERGVRVTVFYRDMRTVSPGAEELYRRARGAGVLFIRTPDDEVPQVTGDEKAESVIAKDLMLHRKVEAPADLVVLAVGMVPDTEATSRLKEILKVPLGADGFFMERHPELGPVETVVDGVFVCGSAMGAKAISDSLSEAGAAAGKAAEIMARSELELEPTIATVDPLRCRGCGTCVEICEFHAPTFTDGAEGVPLVVINEAACKGCGTCVAWCPTGAITARHFTDSQIDTMMETLLQWEAV